VALNDLELLIPKRKSSYRVVLDAGCGQGKSFRLLTEHFSPQQLIGIDADRKALQYARAEASKERLSIELRQRDIAELDIPDASVDLLCCHQTFQPPDPSAGGAGRILSHPQVRWALVVR
jgi:ubiquinone/menaquinone biosynthesis C-methylase UbiE